jgi:hypothetical protein
MKAPPRRAAAGLAFEGQRKAPGRQRSAHWLAGIWIGAALLLTGLVFAQTVLFNVLGASGEKVWKWILSAVVPTASLMIGVLVAQARPGGAAPRRQADGFLFGLAVALSLAYLLALAATIAAAALQYSMEPVDSAGTFLQAFNGLVAAALGAFFVTQSRDPAAPREPHTTHKAGPSGADPAVPAGKPAE